MQSGMLQAMASRYEQSHAMIEKIMKEARETNSLFFSWWFFSPPGDCGP